MFLLDDIEIALQSRVGIGVAIREVDLVAAMLKLIIEGKGKVTSSISSDAIPAVADVAAPTIPTSCCPLIFNLREVTDLHTVFIC